MGRNDDDGATAALACTAGTNLGDNLAAAFGSCFGDTATMRKVVKKMQLARNDEQCYSYDEIMQWVQEEYADDACVLQSIGWMNDNFDFNEDAIMSDVSSLNPVVTAPLMAGHEDCVADVMDYVEDHECADSFTEEEQDSLLDTAEKIASYESSSTSSSRAAWSSLSLLARNKNTIKRESAQNIRDEFDQINIYTQSDQLKI